MVVSDRVVLLARVLAVFGVNAALGIIASLFSDQAGSLTFSWLVPMTTVSALALAVATWSGSAQTGVGDRFGQVTCCLIAQHENVDVRERAAAEPHEFVLTLGQ